MKKKNLIFTAFILFGLFVFMSVKAFGISEKKIEKRLNIESNRISVSISNGNFIEGQCDGNPTRVCDMVETSASRATNTGASSAKISINNSSLATIDFLKYNLNYSLKTQLLKGTYTLSENFRIEQEGLKSALGFANSEIELKAGTYTVKDAGGMFTVKIPLHNGSKH